MRKYEAIFVLDPEKEIEGFKKKIEDLFKRDKIKINSDPKIERKELYHPIKKKFSTTFVCYEIESEPDKIEQIKTTLRHDSEILRYTFFKRSK